MSEPIKNRRLTMKELLQEVIEDDLLELDTRERAADVLAKVEREEKEKGHD